jgi:3-hydroxyisobutyrate dehydrogenase/glyoxylate/succinic semialdehyde reductase
MAANLHKKGHELIVYNRTKAKALDLSEEGIMVVDSPSAFASRVDVIISMVSNPQAVRHVALKANGFLNQLKPGSIWIDYSTVNPSFSRQMAAECSKHNIRFMDAPVAGSKGPAATGELVFFVGGEDTDLQECYPYFSAMGRKVVHVGPAGSGAAMKMVFNLLLGNAMVSFAEGMSLGRSMGLSQEQLFDVLMGSPVLAPFIALKKDKITTGNFEADFPLRWMQKDLHLAALCGYENEAALPLTNTAKELYAQAKNQGLADLDFAAIYRLMND